MRRVAELVRRYLVFLLGLAVMALAVAVMSKAALGISPIQSLCYVIYRRFPDHISLGTLVFGWNCTLLLLQWPLKGRSFAWINLLQIPLSLFLGSMVDVFGKLLVWLTPESILVRVFIMLCGVVILAFSISIMVAAKTVMNPGEAFVAVLADKLGRPFGRIKIAVDVMLITAAVIVSLFLFGKWRFDIIGLGTVVAATTTGFFVGIMNQFIKPAVEFICSGRKEKE